MWKCQTISIYLNTKNSPRNVNPEIIKHFLTMFQYLAQVTNTIDKKIDYYYWLLKTLFLIIEMVPSAQNLDEYYQIKSQINSFWHFLCVVVAKMSKKSKKIGLFRHNSQLLNSNVFDA